MPCLMSFDRLDRPDLTSRDRTVIPSLQIGRNSPAACVGTRALNSHLSSSSIKSRIVVSQVAHYNDVRPGSSPHVV